MARNTEALHALFAYTDVPLNGKQSVWSRLFNWLPSWKPTSESLLEEAEREVLKSVKTDHRDVYVPIAREAVIRTYVAEPTETGKDTQHYPLVMIHGFGAGFLQFYKNLDHLHRHRRLVALDIPGFGRSTRIPFTADARAAEEEMVAHLETWRRVMGLERFVLLGHSLGAFLACSYSISHPERVQHLILVDPWGLSPPLSQEEVRKRFPFLAKKFWQTVGRMKPFDAVRMAGPWGEEAFYQMQYMYGWAKRPMLPRLGQLLDTRVPVTLILGQRSWMKSVSGGKCLGEAISQLRQNSYVELHTVAEAGHHVHADQPEAFCALVNAVCDVTDNGRDREPKRVTPTSPRDKR